MYIYILSIQYSHDSLGYIVVVEEVAGLESRHFSWWAGALEPTHLISTK
jgi:hypothetical protein